MFLEAINGRLVNLSSAVQRFIGFRVSAKVSVLEPSGSTVQRVITATADLDGNFSIPVLLEEETDYSVPDSSDVFFSVFDANDNQLYVSQLRLQNALGDIIGSTDVTTRGGGGGGSSTLVHSLDANQLDEGNLVLISVSFSYEDNTINPGGDLTGNTDSVLNRRVKGKVLDVSARLTLRNNQVILYGVQTGGSTEPRVLGVAMTDNEGAFSMPYPYGRFDDLQAIVSVVPDQVVKIPPTISGTVPNFLWIVVKLPEDMTQEEQDECACHNIQDIPVLPDMEELVSSSQYRQDIGGSCVNFTTPNRSLEEFAYYYVVRTSDPELYSPERYKLEDRLNWVNLRIAEIQKQIRPFSGFPVLNLSVINNINIQEYEPEGEGGMARTAEPEGGITLDVDLLPEELRVVNEAIGVQNTTVQLQAEATTAFLNNNVYNRNLAALRRELQMLRAERDRLERMIASLGRITLNGRHPIDWDDSDGKIGVVQAASIAFGHILHLKQVWKAAGYSLGDLLYSLPLAPGQKKQIAVMEWDRRETASRTESLDYADALSNSLSRDRDINEIVRANLSEHQSGSSHSRLRGSSVGAGVGYGQGSTAGASGNYSGINLAAGLSNMLGVSGGFSASRGESWSDAVSDNTRNVFATSEQKLRDRTMQNASSVRSQRASVVTTAGQSESFRVTTEVVANHNHCHAITIQYFEVLRHFAVHHELADVQECLFIPFLMENFDRRKILRWRDVLSTYLFAPSVHMPQLLAGFDALQREEDFLKGDSLAYAMFPAGRYCDEFMSEITGALNLKLHVVKPQVLLPSGEDLDFSTVYNNLLTAFSGSRLGWWTGGLGNIITQLAQQIAAQIEIDKVEDNFQMLIANENFVNDFCQTIKVYAILKSNPSVKIDLKMDATIIANNNWYRNDKASMAKTIQGKIDVKSGIKSGTGDPRIGDYELTISLRPTTDTYAAIASIRRSDLLHVEIKAQSLPVGSTCQIQGGTFRYQTPHYAGLLFGSRSIQNDINGDDTALISTPLATDEMRNPRQEDKKNADLLERHLESSMEYYHKVLWTFLDEQRVFNLLDKYTVDVPEIKYKTYIEGDEVKTGLSLDSSGKPIITWEKRSVASVVEHKRIGFAGNSVIFPVAKGLNVNRDFLLVPKFIPHGEDPSLGVIQEDQKVELMDFYKPKPGTKHEPKPFRISVPTKGLFAEAVSGACNSCEKIDDSRFWKWEEHPIDEPTKIQEISTESRRKDPLNTTPTAFPNSLIQMQSAPNAPDPTGLAAAFTLLGKADSFRDITGLTETQKNALSALTTASTDAKYYADLARQLASKAGDNSLTAMQKIADHDIAKREKLLSAIDKIEASKLEPEAKAELMKKAFDQLLGDSVNMDKLTDSVKDSEDVRSENEKKGKYDDAMDVLDRVAGTDKVELDKDGNIKLEDAVIDGEGDDDDDDDAPEAEFNEEEYRQYVEWIQEIDLPLSEDGKRWAYMLAVMKAMKNGTRFEDKADLLLYLLD